jgi:hypothetical protein
MRKLMLATALCATTAHAQEGSFYTSGNSMLGHCIESIKNTGTGDVLGQGYCTGVVEGIAVYPSARPTT